MTTPMTRSERIELAVAQLSDPVAKAAFRKAADVFPEMFIYWDEEDPHAFLEVDGVAIEFWSLR